MLNKKYSMEHCIDNSASNEQKHLQKTERKENGGCLW